MKSRNLFLKCTKKLMTDIQIDRNNLDIYATSHSIKKFGNLGKRLENFGEKLEI